MNSISINEHVAVEALILANHVEAVNGLLYMSGGGWTDHSRNIQPNGQPPVSHFGVALSIRVPWNDTNRPHPFTLRIENEDSTVVIATVQTQINVGRPSQLDPGAEQHVMIGVNVDTIFPAAGRYRIFAQMDETGDSKSWAFRVHDVRTSSTVVQAG